MDNKGFSLIEVVGALGILVIGMVGLSSLYFQNVRVQQINSNNLIASMLAQEGIELVRNIRDENWLQDVPWNSGFTVPNATTTFAIDYSRATNTATSIASTTAKLYMNGSGYYTSLVTSTGTPFSRLITVRDFPSSSSTVVKSLVRWKRGVQNYDYLAETVLYDWR